MSLTYYPNCLSCRPKMKIEKYMKKDCNFLPVDLGIFLHLLAYLYFSYLSVSLSVSLRLLEARFRKRSLSSFLGIQRRQEKFLSKDRQ